MSNPRYVDDARDGSKLLTKADVGVEMDFSPTTLEEEAKTSGWNRLQKPVGGTPEAVSTSGMRGEPDYDSDTVDRHGQYPAWDTD